MAQTFTICTFKIKILKFIEMVFSLNRFKRRGRCKDNMKEGEDVLTGLRRG